ncbi:MAG: FAD-binding oxidoreductase [Hydrogenophilus sp.]|nr:FAD-binding oxidoreductase [Hydrogenophilus sp.]
MSYTITIVNHANLRFSAESGQTILDAALAAGYLFPYGCRDGACGACKGRILSGAYTLKGIISSTLLTDDERARGTTLFCRAIPTSDLTIEVETVRRTSDPPVHKFPARVEAIDKIGHIAILTLKLPATLDFRFHAGQYVDILLPDGARRSFSIASSPDHGGYLELHIRLVPGGRFTTHVFAHTQIGDLWRLEGPFGTFTLRDEEQPLLFVAGGTGFAPVQSMLLQLAARSSPPSQPVRCYFGARTAEELYRDAWLRDFIRIHPWLIYTPVLSEADATWSGRRGLVHRIPLEELSDLSAYQIYLCGAPAMIEAARRDYLAAGVPAASLHLDAFTFQHPPS